MVPKPIYELLPYLYMLGGLITLFSLDNILGKICGLILIIVGIVVHQVRARFRFKKPVYPKNSGRDPKSGRLVANPGREPVSRRAMPDRRSIRP